MMLDPMYRLRLSRYRGPRGRVRLWRLLARLTGWRRPEPPVIVHFPISRPNRLSRGTRPE